MKSAKTSSNGAAAGLALLLLVALAGPVGAEDTDELVPPPGIPIPVTTTTAAEIPLGDNNSFDRPLATATASEADDGFLELSASESMPPGAAEGSSSGVPGCASYSVSRSVEDDFEQPVHRDWLGYNLNESITFGAEVDIRALPHSVLLFSETGSWIHVECDGDVRLLPEGGPPVEIEGVLLKAVNQLGLPKPAFVTAPPVGAPRLTRMVDWLAVDPADWQRYTATASTGRVWVSVVVNPARTEWDMGDGNTVTCDGPGRVWENGMSYEHARSYCEYSYHHTSASQPGGTYTMTATVFYTVNVTTNAPVAFDTFEIQRSNTTPVLVQERLVRNGTPGGG